MSPRFATAWPREAFQGISFRSAKNIKKHRIIGRISYNQLSLVKGMSTFKEINETSFQAEEILPSMGSDRWEGEHVINSIGKCPNDVCVFSNKRSMGQIKSEAHLFCRKFRSGFKEREPFLIKIGPFLGSNISPPKALFQMIFLFSSWNMLLSWIIFPNFKINMKTACFDSQQL